MRSICSALLSIVLFVVVSSSALAQSTQLSPPSFETPLGYIDWESIVKAEEFIPPWYRRCSCYYTPDDCTKTKRGVMCDWVGDCVGENGCICRSPKPQTKINGAFICGDPADPGQCDGVCIRRRPLAHWHLVSRIEVARFADLLLQAYVGAVREGGPALVEPLQQAGRLKVTGDWQLAIEGAVDHVLMTLLGRDFLPATAHARAGGEPRGQVLRTNPAGIKLLDTVREVFVAVLAGKQPAESVDRTIGEFWKKATNTLPITAVAATRTDTESTTRPLPVRSARFERLWICCSTAPTAHARSEDSEGLALTVKSSTVCRRRSIHHMKIESIREVKAKLNKIVGALSGEGSVVITKNGRPCAVLMPVTQNTELEIVAISQNKRFWQTYDRALRRAEKEGWTSLDDV